MLGWVFKTKERKKKKQKILTVYSQIQPCDTKVRLHTHSVCYLALSRGVLAEIFVKHKSMMTVIRVHVYTAVCTCHTHFKRHVGAHKSMITIPTPSSKTTSRWAAVPACFPCFVQHMITHIWWFVNTYLDSGTTPTPWCVWSRALLF